MAGFLPRSAQTYVSAAERMALGQGRKDAWQEIRKALIYLESAKRREREWKRKDDAVADKIDWIIECGPEHPGYERLIIDRLVDLLWDGRGEEFDALAAKVAPEIGQTAGEIYLDQSKPQFPETCIIQLRGPTHDH